MSIALTAVLLGATYVSLFLRERALPLRRATARLLPRVLVNIAISAVHGIHHSSIQEENLSNFGVVFSWWDRLHRTLRLNVRQHEVSIGIPGYARPDDNRLQRCLLLPFEPQRDYWCGRVARDPSQGDHR